MDVTTSTVPGMGSLHDCVTRDGHRFRLIVEHSNERHVVFYGVDGDDDSQTTITLEGDEADHVANLLHSRPIADRLAEVERRLADLAGAH